MNLSSLARRLAHWGAALCVAGLGSAYAQVTYFDKPPTPEALREALLNSSGARPGVDQPKGRGIVWDPAAAQGERPAPGAGGAGSAAATTPATAATPAPSQPPVGVSTGPAAALPILFEPGSARVLPVSLPYVEAVAAVLSKDGAIRLTIEGHTDSTGAYSRNMLLSWERAYAVYKLLVERHGIDPARMQPVGRGPLEPVPGLAPADGANRRVQFRLAG